MLVRFLFSVFSCLLLSLPAYADDWGKLVKLLSFQQYNADFEQQTFDEKNQVLQQMHGTVFIEKPNKFFWQSQAPYAQILVGNGKNIWHYDQDLEQVVVQDYKKQASSAPILLILKDTNNLKQNFALLETAKDKQQQWFVLQPLKQDKSLQSLKIGFLDGQLASLDFADQLGQKTQIRFSNQLINQKIPASQFEFTVPEGADVVYE